MIIKIVYESKYSLSTTKDGQSILTGMAVISENINKTTTEIFKKENSFLENIKELNKVYPNYKYADITPNTVLGILCRLVGEVRRLDDLDSNHPILILKDKITFKNVNNSFQNEVVLLHTPLKEVQNNAGGLIPKEKEGHFLLTKNNLSESLLSVFELKTQQDIIIFLTGIRNNDENLFYSEYNNEIKVDTFVKEHLLAEPNQPNVVSGLSFIIDGNILKEINSRLYYGDLNDMEIFQEEIMENEKKVKPSNVTEIRKKHNINEIFNIWGFLFAKKIDFLRKNNLFTNEFENSLNTNKSSIKGLAPNSGSMTIKDYYSNFVSEKKMSWTMPYSVDIKKDLFKKEDLSEFNSNIKLGVTKESGELFISLDLSKEEEIFLCERIENAAVNSFYLGKKGLAYVDQIILEKK